MHWSWRPTKFGILSGTHDWGTKSPKENKIVVLLSNQVGDTVSFHVAPIIIGEWAIFPRDFERWLGVVKADGQWNLQQKGFIFWMDQALF